MTIRENAFRPTFLDKFENKFRLQGKLVTLTGLHIGAGASGDPLATDSPVVRNTVGEPYIPGSSLKGVLRSATEGLLRGAFDRTNKKGDLSELWSCDFVGRKPCVSHDRLEGIRQETADRIKAAKQEGDDVSELDAKRMEVRDVWKESCTVCRLFGSLALASRVRFPDLPMIEASGPLEVRNGVGIDRDRELAADGVLYDFEAVPPSTVFDLLVLVDNGRDHEIGLIVYLFDELHRGQLALGGKSSRGLGRVAVTWERLEEITLKQGSPFAHLLQERQLLAEEAGLPQLPLPKDGDQELWRQIAESLDSFDAVDESVVKSLAQQNSWTKALLIDRLSLGKGRKWLEPILERLQTCGRLVERDGMLIPRLVADEAESDSAELTRRLRPVYQRFVGSLDEVWQQALPQQEVA